MTKMQQWRESAIFERVSDNQQSGGNTNLRTVRVLQENPQYADNRVRNTKYTVWSFVPRQIGNQFLRFMNRYFLLIACLQLIPTLTPVSPLTTWLPLLVIFSVTAAREALDEYRRFRTDCLTNQRAVVKVMTGGSRLKIDSQHLRVGDCVELKDGQEVPCDVVLVYADQNDSCYVQTLNIDGESDLKLRQVVAQLRGMNHQAVLTSLEDAVIECPLPNADVYSFDAVLHTRLSTHSITASHLLLQGCTVKCAHLSKILGLVVYTGGDTKLSRNKHAPRVKTTRIDTLIDKMTWYTFLMQLLLVLVAGSVGVSYSFKKFKTRHLYLYFDPQQNWQQIFVVPLRMLLLLSFMIPISLKVSLDIVKLMAAKFIEWDLRMYDRGTDHPACALNTGIAEDLGQIEYVLTDKTGTLTNNVMTFKECVIGGRVVVPGMQKPSIDKQDLQFWRVLAICHSLSLQELVDGSFACQGSSPDEVAMFNAAASQKVQLTYNASDAITLKVHGQLEKYKLLHVLPFSSERKRMSVIVSDDTRILLLTKGADEVLMPRCRISAQDEQLAQVHISTYARHGYRTFCVAVKELSHHNYRNWHAMYDTAQKSVNGRDAQMQQCYDMVERDMQLAGVLAIEDELQHDVPETIQLLKAAGVKVWMLTGDKVETAIQIAKSCSLISQKASVRMCVLQHGVDVSFLLEQSLRQAREMSLVTSNSTSPLDGSHLGHKRNETCVAIDGSTLQEILAQGMTDQFTELCLLASSVVCCRVTPAQKATVVTMIKNLGHVTLAIGDGGNDVAMIQAADVGVGITGKEGQQAARAADYTIAQFRFLSRLLLVHGRYAYNRTAYLALFCIYKSILIGGVQLIYQLACGFSGTSLLPTFTLSTYNILFTSLPVLAYILDKDVSERLLIREPRLYQQVVRGHKFNFIIFFKYALLAGFHAVLAMQFGSSVVTTMDPSSQSVFAMLVYSVVISVQTATILLDTNTMTLLNLAAIVGSLLMFLIVGYCASRAPIFGILGTLQLLYSSSAFWLYQLLTVAVALLPTLLKSVFSRPRLSQQRSMAASRFDIEMKGSSDSLLSKSVVQHDA